MHTCFGIPNIVVEVAHFLDHLCMDSDNQIATYNVAFCKGITHRQSLIILSMSGKGELKKEQ